MVRQGECMLTIAHRHGHADWQVIWNHPGQRGHAAGSTRPDDPLTGDRLWIPDPPASSLSVSPGGSHRFRGRRPGAHLNFVIKDEAGQALAGKRFVCVCEGRPPHEGTTDAEGAVSVEVPLSAVEARPHRVHGRGTAPARGAGSWRWEDTWIRSAR